MANVNSDLYDGSFAPAGKLGGRVRVAVDSFAVLAADLAAGNILNLVRLPADARVISIKTWNDTAIVGTVNVGLYRPDGTVADVDAFASEQAFAQEVGDGRESRFETEAIDNAGDRLWEIAAVGDATIVGNAEPSEYDLAITVVDDTGAADGNIAFAILYTID